MDAFNLDSLISSKLSRWLPDALECVTLMSSDYAGGHINKLTVTVVKVLLVPVYLSPKRTEKLCMAARRDIAYTQGGIVVTACQAANRALVVLDLNVFARGDLSINAQGHPFSVLLMSRPPCLCRYEARVFVLLSVIESPRMCVVVVGG